MARDSAGAGRTRYGLIVAGVAVVGVAAGAAIAGVPTDVPNDIRATDIQPAPSTTAAPEPSTTPEPAVTTDPPPESSSATAPPASSTSPPDTTPTTTTVASPPPPRPVEEVSVVVANGGGANGLAGDVRDDLRTRGYVEVSATNADRRFAASVVYFAPGFEQEAARLARDLGIVTVEAAPAEPVTENDATAEVVIVLGGDRL